VFFFRPIRGRFKKNSAKTIDMQKKTVYIQLAMGGKN
jgi:hypothetical protein